MIASQPVIADYRTTALSLTQLPIAFIRAELAKRRVLPIEQLMTWEPSRRCKVAALVLLRQRPSTARGIAFMRLEDETGTANLIVRVDVWEHFHRVAQQATAMLVQYIQQPKHGIAYVVVDVIEDLAEALDMICMRIRGFSIGLS